MQEELLLQEEAVEEKGEEAAAVVVEVVEVDQVQEVAGPQPGTPPYPRGLPVTIPKP